MTQKRIYYAVQQAGIAKLGTNTFTSIHGLQSVGVNTKFNLEQVFEIGQVSIYQNIENIPDVEVTAEKVLDGYPLIYHLATYPSTSATLSGRSNTKCTVGISIYGDVQDSASGTPIAQCTMSGMFCSSLDYKFPTQGNCTESITLVGNNKIWTNSFTPTAFTNTDAPSAVDGVQRRQMVLMGSAGCTLPQDIPGISASGTNELSGTDYLAHLQNIGVSTNLGREQLFELGRRGVFHRYVSFPVEVKCDIEVLAITGDNVQALEDATSNLTNRTIKIKLSDSTLLNLGTQNKLSSVTYGGGNAGQQGGNVTQTFSYINFNDLTVTQSSDPSGL